MKKHLIIGGLCFAIGASTVLYVGLNEDVRDATHALVLQSEKAQELEAKQVELHLQSGKLDLQLKEAETAVKVREAEIQLRALERREQELVNAESETAQRKQDLEWAKTLIQTGWMMACGFIIPIVIVLILSLYVLRFVVSFMLGSHSHHEEPVYEEEVESYHV